MGQGKVSGACSHQLGVCDLMKLPNTPHRGSWSFLLVALLVVLPLLPSARVTAEPRRFPDILIITVDTLRFDRLSINGYDRPTSPNIDRLLESGTHFTQARVVEPLTTPSLCSLLTSLYPHEHGATRNGLRIRPGLVSLPTILKRRGYRTAAFVGNWTLKDHLSGLAEHFDHYEGVFSRKRWLGLFNSEATAEDLSTASLSWIQERAEDRQRWPFLAWVHYVEPHAPYRFQEDVAGPLGIGGQGVGPSDRYDTEIAFVDRAIGRLLTAVRAYTTPENLLIIFVADHGESLGEHGYSGHGRHLYDVTLKVPMGLSWLGRIPPGKQIDAPASNLDVVPTVLGLFGLPAADIFQGYDWAGVLQGGQEPVLDRTTFHQAHKGATRPGREDARREGLLEVGLVRKSRKEIYRLRGQRHRVFDLEADAGENSSLVTLGTPPSSALSAWLMQVQEGLAASDDLPPPMLDEESIEQLRALGYLD